MDFIKRNSLLYEALFILRYTNSIYFPNSSQYFQQKLFNLKRLFQNLRLRQNRRLFFQRRNPRQNFLCNHIPKNLNIFSNSYPRKRLRILRFQKIYTSIPLRIFTERLYQRKIILFSF